jgi:hypothetical protein
MAGNYIITQKLCSTRMRQKGKLKKDLCEKFQEMLESKNANGKYCGKCNYNFFQMQAWLII